MPDLRFEVQGAAAVPYAATPLLALKLRVANALPAEEIHTVVLRCQVQIDAPRRGYDERQQARLAELFGEPSRWAETLRPLLWANLVQVVPRFVGQAEVDLLLPCTYDFDLAASKLLHGLGDEEDGELPLTLLFSGSVFYEREDALQVAQIPWSREVAFRLPSRVWKQVMDLHYPGRALLPVSREVFDRLYQFRIVNGLVSWEQALNRLLPAPAAAETARTAG